MCERQCAARAAYAIVRHSAASDAQPQRLKEGLAMARALALAREAATIDSGWDESYARELDADSMKGAVRIVLC
ncbi:MAG: hypothetical protein WCA82_13515 [Jiangellales bacterium]